MTLTVPDEGDTSHQQDPCTTRPEIAQVPCFRGIKLFQLKEWLTVTKRTDSTKSSPSEDTCEIGESSKKLGEWSTERCIVAVSSAGVLVSALVLIVVLVPLIITRKSPSTLTAIYTTQNKELSTGSREPTDGNNGLDYVADEISAFSNEDLPTPYYSHEDITFYNYVADNVRGSMNANVDPCEDFYEYACGNWQVHHPPPEGVSRWSNFEDMTVKIWSMMEDELELIIKIRHTQNQSDKINQAPNITLHQSLLANADKDILDLVVDYYTACTSESQLKEVGAIPLKSILTEMDSQYQILSLQVEPLQAFQRILEYVHHNLSVHVFFSWKVEMDNSIANNMVIEISTPNIDLIPQGTVIEGNEKLIKTYEDYAIELLHAVGGYEEDDVESEAATIVDMLKIFQPLSGSPLVNDTDTHELNTLAPFLDWQVYFNMAFNRVGAHIKIRERILSLVQDYLQKLSTRILSEIAENGTGRLYTFLRWQVLQYYGQFLHKEVRNTILPLFDGISGENTSALPNFRYRPCIKELEEKLALPTAYLFLETVKQRLDDKATLEDMIRRVDTMANKIREEYKNYIKSFTWVKSNVKDMMVDKLENIGFLVGYPRIANDAGQLKETFQDLQFSSRNLIENQINLLKFNQHRKMKFLRQPATYSEWEVLSPMSLISFYVYRRNVLLVPLGGFTYPLFTKDLPEVLNYATIGLFIAHELGHSVDFVGRTRDKYGRANATLWDDASVNEFIERVLCRVREYSAHYYPIEGLLTIAEVMADDGSIGTAYRTIRDQLQHTYFPAPIQEILHTNISVDQFFFLYYAQLFCTISPPGSPLTGVGHYPPHSIRVQATLANTPDFHQAFHCKQGSSMMRDTNKCDVW